jgi:hypothetical protein
MKEATMLDLEKTDWEILNATADDAENLEQIYQMVCFEPYVNGSENPTECQRRLKGAPLLGDVANRVKALVENGLLAIVMDENGRPLQDLGDLSYVWRGWFAMTLRGRQAWEDSPFFLEQQQSP